MRRYERKLADTFMRDLGKDRVHRQSGAECSSAFDASVRAGSGSYMQAPPTAITPALYGEKSGVSRTRPDGANGQRTRATDSVWGAYGRGVMVPDHCCPGAQDKTVIGGGGGCLPHACLIKPLVAAGSTRT